MIRTDTSSAAVQDEELVARMLRHDNRAWHSFTRRYRRLIVATVRRILARFPDAQEGEVEDIYAALMSSLVADDMAKLRSFDFARGHKLSSWLGLLANHAAFDHLRQMQRRGALYQALSSHEPAENVDDPVRAAIGREECQLLLAIRERLTRRDRQFFDVMYVQEATVAEAARKLGISMQTVYTKNRKVRVKLAKGLSRSSAPLRSPAHHIRPARPRRTS